VVASDAEVRKRYEKEKREAFPSERDYRRFLKSSGRTEADLLFQVKLSVLTDKLKRAITGRGGKKGQQQARLEVFVERFQKTYKRQTVCRRTYASKAQCGRIVD
jgi:foldase protein PrsA